MREPIKVQGAWDEGYVYDLHTLSSKYIGEDPFGHERFENVYTPIGKLLHSMKYNGQIDTSDEILEEVKSFIDMWLKSKEIDIVLPVPPTIQRERFQPVFLISKSIAGYLNTYYSDDVLRKDLLIQSKNLPKESKSDIEGSIVKMKDAKRDCNILLVDDVYSTGSTASECVRLLKSDNHIKNVYFFAITKTR